MRRPHPGDPPPRHGHGPPPPGPPPHHWPPPPPRFVPYAGPPPRGGRARRGELRLIFLEALRDGPKHGYEIIRRLNERSSGQYVPSPGTVYPTLQYLEEAELIGSETQGDRRVYRLTAKGAQKLESHAQEVEEFWRRHAQPQLSPANLHELDFLHHELHELQRTVLEGVRILMDSGPAESLRKLRQALEQCKNQARDVIAGHSSKGENIG